MIRDVHPGFVSRNRILIFLPILDPGFKKAADPAVLRIRIRIMIRIHLFLGLLDPDPLVKGLDPDLDPALDRILLSISKNSKKTLISTIF
jgi:hypothetical protein